MREGVVQIDLLREKILTVIDIFLQHHHTIYDTKGYCIVEQSVVRVILLGN